MFFPYKGKRILKIVRVTRQDILGYGARVHDGIKRVPHPATGFSYANPIGVDPKLVFTQKKRKKIENIIFLLNLQFLSISEKRLRFPLKLFLFKYSSHFSIIILLSIACHKTSVPIHFTNFKKLKERIPLLPYMINTQQNTYKTFH